METTIPGRELYAWYFPSTNVGEVLMSDLVRSVPDLEYHAGVLASSVERRYGL